MLTRGLMTLMIREENEVEPTPKMTLAERMGYGVKGKQIVAASVVAVASRAMQS